MVNQPGAQTASPTSHPVEQALVHHAQGQQSTGDKAQQVEQALVHRTEAEIQQAIDTVKQDLDTVKTGLQTLSTDLSKAPGVIMGEVDQLLLDFMMSADPNPEHQEIFRKALNALRYGQ
jgi:hypothetical protein